MQNIDVFWRMFAVQHRDDHVPVAHIAKNGPDTVFLACSACSGDYEDPDVTAWAEDFDEGDEVDESERATTAEKFPVQRN